ncbi:MAG: cytochrome c [Alphaproteobacteria bacterium]|nr:cytochrome c [Alphaproteobacteria bacterium]
MPSALDLLRAAVVASGVTAAAAADAQEPAWLANLLRQDCGSCHGLTMRGGLGAPLLPERLAGKPDEALAGLILDGLPGTAMPPWRGILSEADALWMVRQLKQGIGP